MTNIEMMKKLVVLEAGALSYQDVRLGTYTEEESEIVNSTISRMSRQYGNLVMFDDISDIDTAIRELKKHKPDIVVDDYIQLINVPHIDQRRLQLEYILRQYKWAIKAEKTVAVLVSQLSRASEQRTNKRPILSDLRESGSLEQDAEMVLFNHYDWQYNKENSEYGRYGLELIIGKHRYGTTGTVPVGVHGDGCKICETVSTAEKLAYK
jgi:replicative DNA helicase